MWILYISEDKHGMNTVALSTSALMPLLQIAWTSYASNSNHDGNNSDYLCMDDDALQIGKGL